MSTPVVIRCNQPSHPSFGNGRGLLRHSEQCLRRDDDRYGEGLASERERPMAKSVVGTWRLKRWESRTAEGRVDHPLGRDAVGSLIYTAGGHMAVAMMCAHRPAFASDDLLGGTLEEKALAATGYVTYCGRYEIRNGTVIHHVELSLFPNWVGSTQVRFAAVVADELTITTAPLAIGGETINRLVWERVESAERVTNGRVPRGPGSFLHMAAHQARASLLRKASGAVAREVGSHGCLTDVDAPDCLSWGNQPWPPGLGASCPVSGEDWTNAAAPGSEIGNIAHVFPRDRR